MHGYDYQDHYIITDYLGSNERFEIVVKISFHINIGDQIDCVVW